MFPMVLLTHAHSIWLHGIFLDKRSSWRLAAPLIQEAWNRRQEVELSLGFEAQ